MNNQDKKIREYIVSAKVLFSIVSIIMALFIVMPVIQLLMVIDVITHDVAGAFGLTFSAITTLVLINLLIQLRRKKVKKWDGIGEREKELYVENESLKHERDRLKKMIGLHYSKELKAALVFQIVVFISLIYWFILSGFKEFGYARNAFIIFITYLVAIGITIARITYFLVTKQDTVYLCHCMDVNLTGKESDWGKQLFRDIFEVSHTICPKCSKLLYKETSPEIRIGQILIQKKLIDEKKLNEILKKQKEIRGKKLGDLLIEESILTKEQLDDILKLQKEIILKNESILRD